MTPASTDRVIVVGGGIAGMVTAWELGRAGMNVTLLEASDRLGGQVRRHSVGGIELDAGAESFATRTTAVTELAVDLGLGVEIVTPAPAGAWLHSRNGHTLPLPVASLLGIPASGLDPAVTAIIGRTAALRAGLDRVLPASFGADSRTLGELVRHRMGASVVEKLVAPITMGVHSAHPDNLPLNRVAPGLRAALHTEGTLGRAVLSLRELSVSGSAVAGIRGGMARLVDQLQQELEKYGVDVRLNTPVRSVEPSRVHPDDGTLWGTVVVAAPGLLAEAALRSAVLVTLIVENAGLDAAPRGSGVLVAAGSTVQARALTHQSAKWPWLAEQAAGRHVIRLSYESMPTEPQERARQDAEILLGVPIAPGQVIGFATTTWGRAARQPSSRDAAMPGVFQVGEQIAGTGLASVVGQARTQAAQILDQAGVRDVQAGNEKVVPLSVEKEHRTK